MCFWVTQLAGEDPRFAFDLLEVHWRVFGMSLPLRKYLVHCAKREPSSGIFLPRRGTQGGEIMHAVWDWLV